MDSAAAHSTLDESQRAREIAELKQGKTAAMANLVDEGERALAEEYVLPGGEAPAEEANIDIVPEQADEFTCAACFMVRHRSQLAREDGGQKFCSECEG
ncbi:DUF4193 family protein [Glutamicibacter sp.]|uniref:DUF4193 family protein n=1 Tax=Glutamicibacter sp. TaxID=1931995 RepID=UPI0028BE16B8|nr:DUF4193 family protein [Glutamicibacter sp.]